MNISFLFPGSDAVEALDNWVRTIARYCPNFKVTLQRWVVDCVEADIVFVLTEGRSYPVAKIDKDIDALKRMGKQFGVVHNNDNPGVPTPGDYPSFCWTERAVDRLAKYKPTLLRQPVLPFLMEPKTRPLHLGTFGHIERKKSTLEMVRWAEKMGIPFTAFGPDVLAGTYADYIGSVRGSGNVILYSWADKVEDLGPLFEDVSHFIFMLPRAKQGAGGSPTSPRYATAFARPIIVVDDEPLFLQDNFYVYDSLAKVDGLEQMIPPSTTWGPEEYISELVRRIP